MVGKTAIKDDSLKDSKNFSSNKNYNLKNKSTKGNVTKELIKLNELYKSGALTKEEFEKAKKKVLK